MCTFCTRDAQLANPKLARQAPEECKPQGQQQGLGYGLGDLAHTRSPSRCRRHLSWDGTDAVVREVLNPVVRVPEFALVEHLAAVGIGGQRRVVVLGVCLLQFP